MRAVDGGCVSQALRAAVDVGDRGTAEREADVADAVCHVGGVIAAYVGATDDIACYRAAAEGHGDIACADRTLARRDVRYADDLFVERAAVDVQADVRENGIGWGAYVIGTAYNGIAERAPGDIEACQGIQPECRFRAGEWEIGGAGHDSGELDGISRLVCPLDDRGGRSLLLQGGGITCLAPAHVGGAGDVLHELCGTALVAGQIDSELAAPCLGPEVGAVVGKQGCAARNNVWCDVAQLDGGIVRRLRCIDPHVGAARVGECRTVRRGGAADDRTQHAVAVDGNIGVARECRHLAIAPVAADDVVDLTARDGDVGVAGEIGLACRCGMPVVAAVTADNGAEGAACHLDPRVARDGGACVALVADIEAARNIQARAAAFAEFKEDGGGGSVVIVGALQAQGSAGRGGAGVAFLQRGLSGEAAAPVDVPVGREDLVDVPLEVVHPIDGGKVRTLGGGGIKAAFRSCLRDAACRNAEVDAIACAVACYRGQGRNVGEHIQHIHHNLGVRSDGGHKGGRAVEGLVVVQHTAVRYEGADGQRTLVVHVQRAVQVQRGDGGGSCTLLCETTHHGERVNAYLTIELNCSINKSQ